MLTEAIVILAVWHGSAAPLEAVHGSMESCRAAAEEVLRNAAFLTPGGNRYRARVYVACVPGNVWRVPELRGGEFRR